MALAALTLAALAEADLVALDAFLFLVRLLQTLNKIFFFHKDFFQKYAHHLPGGERGVLL